MDVKQTLEYFDQYLKENDSTFSAVIIGGAALIIMGVIGRDTIDVDCLDPTLPDEIKKLSDDFRKQYPELKLHQKWMNNGPESLKRDLPPGWKQRLVPIFDGKALHLQTLSRLDLLKTKLFAYCDRDQDLGDCIALKPSQKELTDCIEWVSERDANPEWPENVRRHFAILAKRLGHE